MLTASKDTLLAQLALLSMMYSQELGARLAVLELFQIRQPQLQL
jgi:hypothetical protein